MAWWHKRKMSPQLKKQKSEEGEESLKFEEVTPWEADYQLLVCEGLFSEYLEMGGSVSVGLKPFKPFLCFVSVVGRGKV